jgi:hypothetical protein
MTSSGMFVNFLVVLSSWHDQVPPLAPRPCGFLGDDDVRHWWW